MTPKTGSRTEGKDPGLHERAPDPQEAASLPLEPKDGARRNLSNPVGEPDPTADADPYGPQDD